jgi:hypothetical protein
MAIGAWVAFGFRKNRLAAILSGLTIAPPLAIMLLILFATIFESLIGFI